jgi:drug/metabolite transporter (DMT)-like permease
MPPVFMTGARFAVAGLVVITFAGMSALRSLSARQTFNCAIAGIIMSFASFALAVLAIAQGVPTGMVASIIATMPLWLTLFAHWGGERTNYMGWTGIVLGILGAGLLLIDENLRLAPLGTGMAFLAPVFWAAGSYWVRRRDMPSMALASGLQWLSGGLVGLLVGATFEKDAVSQMVSVTAASAWWAWGYLLVFGTLLSYTAYLWLVRNVRAPLAGSNAFVNPVIAVCIGAGLAGEQLDSVTFIAIPLVLIGLMLIVHKPRQPVASNQD